MKDKKHTTDDPNTFKVPISSLSDRKDTRIVCGVTCVWWDSINKVGILTSKSRVSIPCCPHCGGVLFEFPDIEDWWRMVDEYETAGHQGYRAMVEWMQGKCFKNMKEAKATYEANQASRFTSN